MMTMTMIVVVMTATVLHACGAVVAMITMRIVAVLMMHMSHVKIASVVKSVK